MKLVPMNDKIVVKRLDAAEKSPGGILIPDMAKEKPQKGKVLAVGDGKLLESGARAQVAFKDGDTVLFTAWAGSEVEFEGEKLVIMSEADVLAKVEE